MRVTPVYDADDLETGVTDGGVLEPWARVGWAAVVGTMWLVLWSGVAAGLPDGRGYELVSPPDKNGGDVMAVYARVQSAIDGSAAAFSSLSATGDALGTGVATEYVSERTGLSGTRGWATHGITPPQPAMSFEINLLGLETFYQGDFSTDLSRAVVRAWSPLTDAPNVANVVNLYVRDDLRTAGAGSYALVSDCPLCVSPFPPNQFGNKPTFVDASADFGHVLFESPLRLAAGAGSGLNAYEWDHGTVRLAGVLPNGSPAPSSAAGGWVDPAEPSYLGERAISDDGRTIFFSAPPAAANTSVYMRIDASQSVQLNASERTVLPSQPASAAQFEDASSDGSRALFVTRQALTDDAPVDSDRKLYMYDASRPASDPHNLTYINVDHGPGGGSNDVLGVIGASAEGRTVYFIDSKQLVAGEPFTPSPAIFAWHDGTLSYVSEIGLTDVAVLQRDFNGQKVSRIAADGDLLFSVHLARGPTGYDQGNCGGKPCGELYLYRLATQTVSCVSCNPTGAQATANATDVAFSGNGGADARIHETRAISDDGARVLFTTAEALVPEDVNGTSDAYEYDAATGRVQLISSGADFSPSYAMEMTPDGHDMFFVTRQRLVGWDTDNNYDLYDARVDGGFPDPPITQTCEGDGCRAPTVTSPGLTPGSELVSGAGNQRGLLHARVRHRARCRRGRVLRRVHHRLRCLKAPKRNVHAKRARVPPHAGTRRAG